MESQERRGSHAKPKQQGSFRELFEVCCVPEKRFTPKLRNLPVDRGGVMFDDHALCGFVASAQGRCPFLVRHNNYHFSWQKRQFIAAHPPLAFPSEVDDLIRSRLVAYVPPTQFVWQNAEIGVGLIDHRSTSVVINPRFMKHQSKLGVPREWKPPDKSINESFNRSLCKADTSITTADHSVSCNQATFANNRP